MKVGILTDVHERVEHLRVALARFRAANVDRVVVIGDICEMCGQLEETCRLLAEARAIGVWGNHDYGLCRDPEEDVRRRYSATVLEFMASLQPTLDLEFCHFCHVEPWLNPEVLEDLWYFGGAPDEPYKLERIFAAVPQRLILMGHYHQWLLATPERIEDWSGERPISLAEGRYFIVVGALCEGRYAILDTDSSEFVPFNEVTA